MKAELIFPTAIILMMLGASSVYAWKGNLKMTLYWLLAGLLNAALTYIK